MTNDASQRLARLRLDYHYRALMAWASGFVTATTIVAVVNESWPAAAGFAFISLVLIGLSARGLPTRSTEGGE